MSDYSPLLPNRMQVVLIGPTGIREVLGVVPISFDARNVVLQVQQLSAGYGRSDVDSLISAMTSEIEALASLVATQASELAALTRQVDAMSSGGIVPAAAPGFFAKQFSPLTLQ